MELTAEDLAARALEYLMRRNGALNLVAIAGPPGAGKSTVAGLLCDRLNAYGRRTAVVPMDGFHLDNVVLKSQGLFPRKGAVETFDAKGFCNLVARIADGEKEVVYPVFDRARDVAIAGAAILPAGLDFVLIEGNYLLLQDTPWNRLERLWSYTIWIEVPLGKLEDRLIERWVSEGFSESEARAKVEGNDLKNARLVLSRSRPSDLSLSS